MLKGNHQVKYFLDIALHNKKRHPRGGVFYPVKTGMLLLRDLQHDDLRRAGAFLALTNHERDALILFQGFVASALNFAEVCEEVFSAIFRHDEAEALLVVKPLHDTSFCFQSKS